MIFDNIMVLGGFPDLRLPWFKCCLNRYVPRKLKFVYLCVNLMALSMII